MHWQGRKPAPFYYEGSGKELGILLIHGFTGTTLELRALGQALQRSGYTVYAPLLKGHGLTPKDMGLTNWVHWWESVKEGYQYLKTKGCQHIVPIGLSMGGLLSLKLAQHYPVEGIVTLCAPLKVRDRRMGLVKYLKIVMPYKKRKKKKADHIEQELFIYEKTPLSCVQSLANLMANVQRNLYQLNQPVLIIQAEKDETVDPCSGKMLYEQIGSKQKEIAFYKESSHIIILDQEKEFVYEKIISFLDRLELGLNIKKEEIAEGSGSFENETADP